MTSLERGRLECVDHEHVSTACAPQKALKTKHRLGWNHTRHVPVGELSGNAEMS